MLTSFPDGYRALVVGATGGIGGAFVDHLITAPGVSSVVGWSRRPSATRAQNLVSEVVDITDEASIVAAVPSLQDGPSLRLVIVATGLLHEDAAVQPEKTLKAMRADAMARTLAVNTIGPALVAKHVLPLLPRDGKAVFAVLSARVGSISDNRLGGWHSYRASKAALNMLLKCWALEQAVKWPDACLLGLHPGTVDTRLSQPFQRGVAPGKLFSPAQSAGYLLDVIDRATPAQSGQVLAWDGETVPA
jgi:NAD(P)-dependent dehydrogenase (short-subunit alcohol dehydrogenase family)